MRRSLNAVCLMLPMLAAGPATAAEFFIDPVNGDATGDGSAARPWRTLTEVIADDKIETQNWSALPYTEGATLTTINAGAAVKAGDTLWLRDGYHGELSIHGMYNPQDIIVAAERGHTPRFSRIIVTSASHWKFRGLSISPSHAPEFARGTMFTVQSHNYSGPTSGVEVEGCELFTEGDVSGWSMTDWDTRACNGFQVSGDYVIVRRNRLSNVNFGISVSGRHALVEYNTVENFSGDGLRGLGDYGTFQHNTVKNCYDVNANHDDGFQSWSTGDGGVGTGEVRGIVLRGNTFINYTDPNQQFRGTLQGIGCFDGFFVDWAVENNVVITDHWHGITLMGARDSRIVNNTVIDVNTSTPGPPWIRVSEHKDGRVSERVTIRNNLATDFSIEPGTDIVQDHNIEITDLTQFFVDPAAQDLHLLASATSAVDQGSPELAPDADRDGVPRPQGLGIDIGAYEVDLREPASDAGPPVDAALDASSVDANAVIVDAAHTSAPDGGSTPPSGGSPGRCSCNGGGSSTNDLWLLAAFFAVAVRVCGRKNRSAGGGEDACPGRAARRGGWRARS